MSKELDALIVTVAAINGVVDSAVAVLNNITGQIAAIQAELAQAGIDNAKLNELATDLEAKKVALAQAIANVPPPPPPPPG